MRRVKYNKKNGLPLHDDGQQYQVLGALKPEGATYRLPNFESTYPTLGVNEWQEISLRDWNRTIWNQGQFGSCVGHGSVTGFMISWNISGQPVYEFSPTFVYANINGGRDGGALVSQGLEALKGVGTCFMQQFGESKIYLNQVSPEAKTTAKRFRVSEAFKINSWAQLGSAVSLSFPVVFGIGVGNNFSRLDANGVAPLPDMVAGGHCLCVVGLKKIKGVWMAESHNSWGRTWGQNGYCYIQEQHFDPRYGFPFDAFAIAGVIDDPDDTNEPILFGKEVKHGTESKCS